RTLRGGVEDGVPAARTLRGGVEDGVPAARTLRGGVEDGVPAARTLRGGVEDASPPARLPGNFEGGFAMAAVGAGYHEAFGARIVAGRGLQAADAGAANRPVVVNETFMRVVGRNPVGARVRTPQQGGGREPGPWQEIVGVVTDLWTIPEDWG